MDIFYDGLYWIHSCTLAVEIPHEYKSEIISRLFFYFHGSSSRLVLTMKIMKTGLGISFLVHASCAFTKSYPRYVLCVCIWIAMHLRCDT